MTVIRKKNQKLSANQLNIDSKKEEAKEDRERDKKFPHSKKKTHLAFKRFISIIKFMIVHIMLCSNSSSRRNIQTYAVNLENE